ncbi:hypothetical protein PQX77_007521 [Marasmius sp. AFHP31]|nr:hypothetical protein PQX77_007521 [Marasmius sp. AFHP31]
MAPTSASDRLFIKAFRQSIYVPNDLKVCMANHPHLFQISLRKLDFKLASEFQVTRRNDSLQNTQSKFFHEIARNTRRHTTRSEKALENAKVLRATSTLEQQIDTEKDAPRESGSGEGIEGPAIGHKNERNTAPSNSTKQARPRKDHTAESSSGRRVQSVGHVQATGPPPFSFQAAHPSTSLLRDQLSPHAHSQGHPLSTIMSGSLLQLLYDGEPDSERAPKRPRWDY